MKAVSSGADFDNGLHDIDQILADRFPEDEQKDRRNDQGWQSVYRERRRHSGGSCPRLTARPRTGSRPHRRPLPNPWLAPRWETTPVRNTDPHRTAPGSTSPATRRRSEAAWDRSPNRAVSNGVCMGAEPRATAAHNASAASAPGLKPPLSSRALISDCSRSAAGWLTPASQSWSERRFTPMRSASSPWLSPNRPR